MAAIKYKVELTEAERSRLNEVSQRGKASVRTVKRALALLQADGAPATQKNELKPWTAGRRKRRARSGVSPR